MVSELDRKRLLCDSARMRISPDPELGLRALTIQQPHVGEILRGRKPIEFRTWGTDYRGDLLLTASANPRTLGPFGCTICVCELHECEQDDDGVFCWGVRNPRAVKQLAVKGRLFLWKVDQALAERLELEW